MEVVYQLFRSVFDKILDRNIRVKRFVVQFIIRRNCKNAKTLDVQKTPVG